MPTYRRNYVPGGTFFFTVVTAGRREFLTTERARPLLRQCIADARKRRPFQIVASVLLPDHLHTIWALPPDDSDYSTRWRHIKGAFTHGWLADAGAERWVRPGQAREGRRGIWQPRFIEHTIRNENDLRRHIEYVHYNPVKHNLVRCPKDWPWSSFHGFVRTGIYPDNWCCGEQVSEPESLPSGDWLE